ncbi:hypothetical protein FA95DRAFT_1558994 [Auriscalpium vulgare]|uniref:Uncharacterized protein n=1 Tax=Auriscalpium vulgare TaxID=40419 RepID=A0ACB8RUU7_9AGAM|nr:hypothetical protein FA95DRAFT_1558994 [Auriscalpium vulgare]
MAVDSKMRLHELCHPAPISPLRRTQLRGTIDLKRLAAKNDKLILPSYRQWVSQGFATVCIGIAPEAVAIWVLLYLTIACSGAASVATVRSLATRSVFNGVAADVVIASRAFPRSQLRVQDLCEAEAPSLAIYRRCSSTSIRLRTPLMPSSACVC